MWTRDVDASRASSANATRADAVARSPPRDDGGAMLFVVAAALMAVVAWMLVCLCRVKRAKTAQSSADVVASAPEVGALYTEDYRVKGLHVRDHFIAVRPDACRCVFDSTRRARRARAKNC